MTRTLMLIGGAIVLSALVLIPRVAAQEKQCTDRVRRGLAVNLARQINTLQIQSHHRDSKYSPMSAFPSISVPQGFVTQLLTNAEGTEYLFSVKDTQDPCSFAVFSDQEQVIYTAQPLQ